MLAAPPSRGPSPPHAASLDPFLSPSPAFLFAPSPSSSLAPSPTLHSATLPAPQQHARRMRRLSRHSRPSSANGAAHLGVPHVSPPPPVPSMPAGRRDSAAGSRISSGSSSRQPSPGAPSSSARREAASSQRISSALGFTLPLFVQPDEAASPPPAPASAQYLSVSPTQPMRHNSYKAPRSPVQVSDLPRSRSLRVTLPAPPRSSSALFEASAAAGPSSQPDGDDASRSRRWSASISHSRSAQIFRQAASPYLRAGLEELRSIFDVDSDPIPTSPFDEESDEQAIDGSPLIGRPHPQRELLPSSHLPEPHASERSRCRSDSVRTPRRSGAAAAEASLLPTVQNLLASPSPRRVPGGALSAARSPPMSPPQRANSGDAMSSVFDEKLAAAHAERRRSGDDFALIMPLASGKGTPGLLGDDAAYRPDHVAAGLVAIAVGITTACIWGYRTYADIFSPSLLIFFLVQPGFALMGAAAVGLRRRNLMDLFSRAMRAHVLAQALIALLAFLDLSASASYVRTTAFGGASTWVMDLVPSMQTRFGPLGAPFDAGTAPAASLLAAAHASQGAAQVHAHDTAVGGLTSRVTHLIIFVAQAAAPLLLTLWAQYAVARTLGFLARQGLKRSSRAPSRRTSAKRAPRAAVPSNSAHIAPPPLDVADLSARLQRIDANKLRRVSEAGAPSQGSRAHTLALGEAFGEPAPAPSHGFSLARAQPSQRTGHSRHNRSLSQPVNALASRRLSINVPPPAQHAVELQQASSPSMVSSPARPRLSDGPSSPLRHALVESPESEDPALHWSSSAPRT